MTAIVIVLSLVIVGLLFERSAHLAEIRRKENLVSALLAESGNYIETLAELRAEVSSQRSRRMVAEVMADQGDW